MSLPPVDAPDSTSQCLCAGQLMDWAGAPFPSIYPKDPSIDAKYGPCPRRQTPGSLFCKRVVSVVTDLELKDPIDGKTKKLKRPFDEYRFRVQDLALFSHTVETDGSTEACDKVFPSTQVPNPRPFGEFHKEDDIRRTQVEDSRQMLSNFALWKAVVNIAQMVFEQRALWSEADKGKNGNKFAEVLSNETESDNEEDDDKEDDKDDDKEKDTNMDLQMTIDPRKPCVAGEYVCFYGEGTSFVVDEAAAKRGGFRRNSSATIGAAVDEKKFLALAEPVAVNRKRVGGLQPKLFKAKPPTSYFDEETKYKEKSVVGVVEMGFGRNEAGNAPRENIYGWDPAQKKGVQITTYNVENHINFQPATKGGAITTDWKTLTENNAPRTVFENWGKYQSSRDAENCLPMNQTPNDQVQLMCRSESHYPEMRVLYESVEGTETYPDQDISARATAAKTTPKPGHHYFVIFDKADQRMGYRTIPGKGGFGSEKIDLENRQPRVLSALESIEKMVNMLPSPNDLVTLLPYNSIGSEGVDSFKLDFEAVSMRLKRAASAHNAGKKDNQKVSFADESFKEILAAQLRLSKTDDAGRVILPLTLSRNCKAGEAACDLDSELQIASNESFKELKLKTEQYAESLNNKSQEEEEENIKKQILVRQSSSLRKSMLSPGESQKICALKYPDFIENRTGRADNTPAPLFEELGDSGSVSDLGRQVDIDNMLELVRTQIVNPFFKDDAGKDGEKFKPFFSGKDGFKNEMRIIFLAEGSKEKLKNLTTALKVTLPKINKTVDAQQYEGQRFDGSFPDGKYLRRPNVNLGFHEQLKEIQKSTTVRVMLFLDLQLSTNINAKELQESNCKSEKPRLVQCYFENTFVSRAEPIKLHHGIVNFQYNTEICFHKSKFNGASLDAYYQNTRVSLAPGVDYFYPLRHVRGGATSRGR